MRAIGDGDEYLSSPWFSTTLQTKPLVIPLEVPSPALVSKSASAITIEWSPVEDVSGYTLLWKESSAAQYTSVPLDASATSFQATGLSEGLNYWFKVRSVGDGVNTTTSAYSSTLVVKTPIQLAAPAITNLVPSANSIRVAWQSIENASKYYLAYAPAGSSRFTTVSIAQGTRTHTVTGLSSGASYDFKVRAIGDGDFWASSSYGAVRTAATTAASSAMLDSYGVADYVVELSNDDVAFEEARAAFYGAFEDEEFGEESALDAIDDALAENLCESIFEFDDFDLA